MMMIMFCNITNVYTHILTTNCILAETSTIYFLFLVHLLYIIKFVSYIVATESDPQEIQDPALDKRYKETVLPL